MCAGMTLARLVELTQEVDFAAFVFARDDWTAANQTASPVAGSGQASPRDNVVFEAGLFGGALGMRRTFILPLWWQFSVTARSSREPSAVSLLRISRDRDGTLELGGHSWQEDGTLAARCWSEAAKERRDPASVFYYWKGERPRHPNAPQLEGTGEIRIESADRAAGYFTTRSDTHPKVNARTSGVYLRADPEDLRILDGRDDRQRAELIAERLRHWKSISNS
mgnify:CR=1 FL=1